MSIAIAETPDEAITFADLLHELGDIPPSRIVMRPPPGTATEDDVLRLMEAPRKRLCELIDGVLVEKAMGWKESALAIYVASSLSGFVRPRNVGLIAGADGTIKLWAGRVRIPDVAYISWDRLPGRRMPDKPIPQIAPEIAVEVLSESNTEREMEKKRVDYFKTGVKLLWEIDPEGRAVTVYTSPEDSRLLKENEILEGEEVLPGYTLKLAELFAELDRHG